MKLTAILGLLFGLFLIVHGWTSIEKVEMDPDDPNVCVSNSPHIGKLKLGETKSLHPHMCARATCTTGMIRKAGCGVVGAEEPCKVVAGDLSKPHPDCCDDVVCP